MASDRKTNPVQSVDRSLAILEALASEGGREVGLKELSVMVGLDASTTHRLLQTLMARGFVRQNENDHKYSLGLRVFEVGNAVTYVSYLRELARSVLQSLTAKTGETSNLAILDGWHGIFVAREESVRLLRVVTEVGRVIPLHCTAAGKILLSGLSDDELERFFAQARLEPSTTRSIVSPEDLQQEVSWVRTNGYAVDDEEHEDGAKCVAAPVRNRYDKVVAAISVSGPSVRLTPERMNRFVPVARRAALDLSRLLGYKERANLGL